MAVSARRPRPADPVVVVSSDRSLVTAMQATLGPTQPVVRLTEVPDGADWPSGGLGAVVLDVASEQRPSAYEEIRRHHAGRLILIVGAGEPAGTLPPDGARLLITRPFAVGDLLGLLSAPLEPAKPSLAAGHGRNLKTWLGRLRAGPRRPAALAAAGALLLVTAWFVLGLLQSANELGEAARAARTGLNRVDAALAARDPAEARRALQAAQSSLGAADAAAGRRQVRLAARLPALSTAVADLRRLLAAARRGTRAAGLAIALYEQADPRSPSAALVRDQRVDLAALGRMRLQAVGLLGELEAARRELHRVRGGPLAPGSAGARASGLRQLDELSGRVGSLLPALEALPSALGGDRPRDYMIVLTTPAELRPSGGTPLAAVRMRADGGRVTVRERDAAVSLHHAGARWTAVPGDPWSSGGRFDDFSMANSSPHFPTAGRELIRAYGALTGARLDGVLCVDPMAMRALLRATGPVTVPAYGNVTAANVGRLTMREAYDRWPDTSARRRYNQQLVDAVLRRFLDGRLLLAKLQALGTEAAERHLQVYATDPGVQAALGRAGLDGSLTPAGRDYLAVYTHNTNESRVDYFQRRAIDQRVRLRPDGSASVTRTIRVENRARPSAGLDPAQRTGYTSPLATATVATYLPPGAVLRGARVDGRPVTPSVAEEVGRPLVRVDTALPPGRGVTVSVGYLVPAPAGRDGDTVTYELVADPQPMVEPPELRVEVAVPEGMVLRVGPRWTARGSGASTTVRLATTIRDRIEAYRQ
jgi:Protein of unknown function (DUF4012)